MKPTHCPSCQSTRLAHGRLVAQLGVFFYLKLFRAVRVSGMTCLECGAVAPYLDDEALAKVRAGNGITKPSKAAHDEL